MSLFARDLSFLKVKQDLLRLHKSIIAAKQDNDKFIANAAAAEPM